jgi:heat shock protein HspQ
MKHVSDALAGNSGFRLAQEVRHIHEGWTGVVYRIDGQMLGVRRSSDATNHFLPAENFQA